MRGGLSNGDGGSSGGGLGGVNQEDMRRSYHSDNVSFTPETGSRFLRLEGPFVANCRRKTRRKRATRRSLGDSSWFILLVEMRLPELARRTCERLHRNHRNDRRGSADTTAPTPEHAPWHSPERELLPELRRGDLQSLTSALYRPSRQPPAFLEYFGTNGWCGPRTRRPRSMFR